MTTVLSPNSRFQLLELPIASPGKCVACGAVDRPVVDLGLDLEFFGTIYFCERCITEMGGVFGMVAGQEAITLGLETAQVVSDYLHSNGLVAISREQFTLITSLLAGFRSPISHLSSGIPAEAVVDDGEDEESDGDSLDSTDSGVDEGPSEDYLPISIEGPASVSAVNGDGSTLFKL